jgi:hypothetical protein
MQRRRSFLPTELLSSAADSTGRYNTLVKSFCWCFKAEEIENTEIILGFSHTEYGHKVLLPEASRAALARDLA